MGTALYKLHLKPAARYSEDIDLVPTKPEPAGPMMEALRGLLDPWLGKPKWKQTEGRATFVYRFDSEDAPPVPLKLKVETNTREHFAVYGLTQVPFAVSSGWFEGSCRIQSYELDELLGTKLRALYSASRVATCSTWRRRWNNPTSTLFGSSPRAYMEHEGHSVTRAQFEENIAAKLSDPLFTADISPLLAADFTWDIQAAAPVVSSRLIELLPGDAWKGQVQREAK